MRWIGKTPLKPNLILPRVTIIGLGSSQKSFRAREKFLIVLVFLTFCFVCFCGLFYLPEFGSGRVLNVYKQFQRAGPEMFIPAPPIEQPNHHHQNHHRHNGGDLEGGGSDSVLDNEGHVVDRAKLLAKIREELGDLNLDRPETANQRKLEDSSVSGGGGGLVGKSVGGGRAVDVDDSGKVLQPPNQIEESRREVVVPQQEQQQQQLQQPNMNPMTIPKSDDTDVDVTEKRNKVREVSTSIHCG